jgi:hypothetical protein
MSLRSTTHPFASAGGAERSARGSHHRLLKILLWIFLVLMALILIVRFVVSPIVTSMVNKKLDAMPDYKGHVERVKIALWRGGLEANGFTLHDRKRLNDLPIAKFDEVDMRWSWPALFRGKLGGQMRVDRAELNVVQTEVPKKEDADEAKKKMEEIKAKVEPWRKALEQALPMELTHFEMNDSKIRFVDRAHTPNSEIVLEHIHLVVTGLTNRQAGEEMPARLALEATLTGNGKLKVNVQADPMKRVPTFTTTMELKPMELRAWNEFLRGNMDADISSGTFEMYAEATAKEGRYEGYVKPFFKELDFKSASDKNDKLGTKIKEAAVDVVTKVFDNDGQDKVASKAPFSGTFATTDVDVWTAVETLLRNAFVEALREGFDRGIG